MRTVMRGSLATAIRRSLASVASFAQLLLLFAPLVELRETGHGTDTVEAGVTAPNAPALDVQRGQAQHHDATTCPACIAQSLHAQLVGPVRLPTNVIAEQAPVEIPGAAVQTLDPPATHRSRAPPVAS